MISALLLAAALQTGGVAAQNDRPPRTPCIRLSDSTSTEYVPVDDHTIVVRSFNDWWKLTVTPSSLMLTPDAFLVNDVHGPSELCAAVDFQLSVVERGAGREGLIVQDFRQITPEEGKALRSRARR